MTIALVPVKSLGQAKQRLAPALDGPARAALVLAMLDDVLGALRGAQAVSEIGVISADPAVLARAAAPGAHPLPDHAGDLNAALTSAAAQVAPGADALLVLPADVPLVTSGEIDRLIAAAPARGALIVPSGDGGTNALLVRPPLALPFRFGPDSLARHAAAAREQGLPLRVYHTPGLERDIDRPEDLVWLAAAGGETTAARVLRSLQVVEMMAVV
jgi:2-phospho-L-lactate guanylyltransferase